VPAFLQVSFFSFLARSRLKPEQLGISKPGDGPEHHDERDFPVFNHFVFHPWALVLCPPNGSRMLSGVVISVNCSEIYFPDRKCPGKRNY
jgi:hypothetical protein